MSSVAHPRWCLHYNHGDLCSNLHGKFPTVLLYSPSKEEQPKNKICEAASSYPFFVSQKMVLHAEITFLWHANMFVTLVLHMWSCLGHIATILVVLYEIFRQKFQYKHNFVNYKYSFFQPLRWVESWTQLLAQFLGLILIISQNLQTTNGSGSFFAYKINLRKHLN